MADVFDFLEGADGDLAIKGGDLAFGESTLQHQRDLLVAVPGEFKQTPWIGVGLKTSLLDEESPASLRQRIQRNMERDGMRIGRLRILDRYTIDLQATYA